MTAPSEAIKRAAIKVAAPAEAVPHADDFFRWDLECSVRAALKFLSPTEVTAIVKAVTEESK